MPALLELTIGGTASRWTELGLIDSHSRIADVGIDFHDDASGIAAWTLSASRDERATVDGIVTNFSSAPHLVGRDVTTQFCGAHAIAIDHVVVNTNDLDRTSGAIESAVGAERRRVRDAGHGVTQGFHLLDNTLIEVVSGPHITASHAALWGFVVVVDDIDAVTETLGELVTPKKAAVQSGRFISSFTREAALGVPVAVMTPR